MYYNYFYYYDKEKRKKIILKTLRIIFRIGFVVFTLFFIDEVFIQPHFLKKSINKAKELYNYGESMVYSGGWTDIDADDSEDTGNRDPERDDEGRLLKFKKLLETNEDVKGWIRIDNIETGENDTKIDYVVVQSGPDDPDFYLNRDWATKSYLKAGSIFLDASCSVENNSKNLVIHGHNMKSTDNMFHYLIKYKEIDFLREHPVIQFDTIYEEGLWKIFAVFITPGDNKRGDFFQYNRSTFEDDLDFLEFVHQIRARSLFNINDVDINENDRILTLSTCSYELNNYRIVIVARKVRENEEATVATDSIEKNNNVLYAKSFYDYYGGEPPVVPPFEEALQNGKISWYKPAD